MMSLAPQIDFQGLNSRQDISKIPDEKSIFLRNVSLSKLGTLVKRFGSSILGNPSVASLIQGAIEYYQYSGTRNIIAMSNGNINFFDGSNWRTIASSVFTPTPLVNMALFNNKVYMVSPNDNLISLDSNNQILTVGDNGNQISGKNICQIQNTLFISNITGVGGYSVSQQDRCYFSFTNGSISTDQFYTNAAGQNTILTSQRFFTLHSPIIASFAFGVTGLSYHFTEDACYQFDLRTTSNLLGPQKVFNIGICGPRAICECNGFMIFMDKNGRIWVWGGTGLPSNISIDIDDDMYGDSLIASLNKANLSSVAAGSLLNHFYFSIGNITFQNEVLNNVIIKGMISQNIYKIPQAIFSHDDYPIQANIFLKAKLNNIDNLFFGSNSTGDIWQMNVNQYNDNNAAIPMEVMTKFLNFGEYFNTKESTELFIKYRPQTYFKNYLVVSYAINSNINYTIISDPVNNVQGNGIINMYDLAAPLLKEAIGVIKMPSLGSVQTIGYKFGHYINNVGCEIAGYAPRISMAEINVTVLNS